MTKIISLILLGVGLLLLTVPRPTVHRIVAGDSLGSGVTVATAEGQTLVITANHVIKDGGPYTVAGKPAKVIATDSTWDLAALVVDEILPVAFLSRRVPKLGDSLTACGYGSNSYEENTGRAVQFFAPSNGPSDFVAIDVAARSGDSGGPLFYTDGTIAAVLFGSDNTGAHGSHCLRVRKFLAEIKGYDRLIKALDLDYRIYAR